MGRPGGGGGSAAWVGDAPVGPALALFVFFLGDVLGFSLCCGTTAARRGDRRWNLC